MNTYQDLLTEIRESRNRMSEECHHDPGTYITLLKSFNIKYARQVESYQKRQISAESRSSHPATK